MLYRIEWLIDIDAESPLDAAREALRIHRDPESTAVVFSVARLDDETGALVGDPELVDLTARGRYAERRTRGYHVHANGLRGALSWHRTRAEAEAEAARYPASAGAHVVPL